MHRIKFVVRKKRKYLSFKTQNQMQLQRIKQGMVNNNEYVVLRLTKTWLSSFLKNEVLLINMNNHFSLYVVLQ